MDNWKEKEAPTTRSTRSVDGQRLNYKYQTGRANSTICKTMPFYEDKY